jgi:hypothetical protein
VDDVGEDHRCRGLQKTNSEAVRASFLMRTEVPDNDKGRGVELCGYRQ